MMCILVIQSHIKYVIVFFERDNITQRNNKNNQTDRLLLYDYTIEKSLISY